MVPNSAHVENGCTRAAGSSASRILAGAAAGAALTDSTNRVPQHTADAARRASHTETKRRQRAKPLNSTCRLRGLRTQLPGLQLELGQS
ncbi:TPA: hypothetical protein ACH3X2_005291 [Trebouxia sp. C0005]